MVKADSNQLGLALTKEPELPLAWYCLHAVITPTALWAMPD